MNRVHRPGDDPIRGAQVGRTLAAAIEDEQLMPDQHGFGDNGTESTGLRQSGRGDDQMNEHDIEIAHPGNGINTSQTTALQANLAIRHRQDSESYYRPGFELSVVPTRAYAAIKRLMKARSPGVAAADLLLSDLSADLYESKEAPAAWKGVEESANRGKTQVTRQDRASRGLDISYERHTS